jgi:pyruvate,water dikinase
MDWELDDPATAGVLYSRAVVGELCPGPLSPLTSTLGVGADLGEAWRYAYHEAGLLGGSAEPLAGGRGSAEPLAGGRGSAEPLAGGRGSAEPLAGGRGSAEPRSGRAPVVRFGAHLYLDTSLLRAFGEAVGADPLAFSRQYLAERPDVPRYTERLPLPPVRMDRLAGWLEATLAPETDSRHQVRVASRSVTMIARRPELARCPDSALAERMVEVRAELRVALRLAVRAELGAAVSCELLTRLTEQAGHPAPAGGLAIGVDEATSEPYQRLWALSRQVVRSVKLGRLFDRGALAVAEQVDQAGGGDLARFRSGLSTLLGRYGYLGPAEWELSSPTWGTDVPLVLGLVDSLRRVSDQTELDGREQARARLRERCSALAREACGSSGSDTARFETAREAAGRWLRARERLRRVVSALHHEQRLAAVELGRRQVRDGRFDEVDQIFMLRAGELAEFIAEPTKLADTLRLRSYDYHALARYQPPLVTVGPPAAAVHWPTRDAEPPRPRWPLPGTATSSGVGGGRARVLGSGNGSVAGLVAGLAEVKAGEVLVLPSAGPEFWPVLWLAAGVVVDGGGPLSPVSVGCRSLGIPCVVGTVDGTTRIRPGAPVTVDGMAGVVRSGKPLGGAGAVRIAADPGPGHDESSINTDSSSAVV